MTRTTPLTRSLARLLVGAMLVPQAALAGPAGERVVRGNVTVTRSGADTTVRASNRSIIEWTDFDIAAGESVEFVQPNARARVLNRVTGPDSTEIEGALRANGAVYIINPYGISFGGGYVDVGQLVAAAGNLGDADFVAGIDRFTGLTGRVENFGTIEAGTVALLGASVANHGTITVPNGRIWMLAGDEVIVAEHGSPVVVRVAAPDAAAQTAYAVENTGTLDAGRRGAVRLAAGDLLSLAIHNAGTVRAREIALEGGEGSRVQVGGVLDASNATGGPVRDGGTIEIRGDQVFVDGAVLDASGRRGGGAIHVGGDVQGALADGSDARNAQLTYVSDDSTLRADALVTGDGGEVVVWSDGVAVANGAISARGGERGGDGGFVETSGKQWLSVAGTPDLGAANGRGGEWLLDPANIDVVAAKTVPNGDARDLTDELDDLANALFITGTPIILPEAASSEIEVASLRTALARGIDVTLSTEYLNARSERSSTEEGNITFQTGLDFASEVVVPETQSTLTLRAANQIVVDGAITDATNANLSLTLDFESGDADQPQLAGADFASDPLNESLHLNAGLDVKGQVLLRGARVNAAMGVGISGLAITVDARDAISVGDLTANGGIVRLDSANGGITVDGNVATGGDSFIANAVRGDLAVTGDIDTRIDPLDLESGGGNVELLATAAYELDDKGDPIPPDGVTVLEAQGGDVTLSGATLDAGGGVAIEAGHDLVVSNAITTTGGGVAITISDNPETAEIDKVSHPFVTGGQTATISGPITTNGGSVSIRSTAALETDRDIAVDLALSGDIDTRATTPLDPASDGDVTIEISGDVDVAATVDITGANVQVSAGLGGAGDLTFGTGTTITAENALVEAGDGYSRAILFVDADNDLVNDNADEDAIRNDSLGSQIAFGGLDIQASESVTILQDASLAAGTLGASALDLTGVAQTSLQARDGTLALDATDVAKLASGTGTELVLGGATDVDLQAALEAENVTIALAEQFTIDQAFADMAAGAATRELHVIAGTQGAASDGELFEAVTGTLAIADGVAMRASDSAGASLALELHGGANGAGHLVVGDGVSLTANDIRLRAGDGAGTGTEEQVGGVAVPSEVRFDDTTTLALQGDGSDVRFEIRQDADIDATTATALPAVADPGGALTTTYSLRSDDGDVALGDAVAPVLQDTRLVLAANGFDLAGLTSALRVETLDLGGIGSLRVDQPLLDAFSFTVDTESETTLRAGLGGVGTLSFANGTVVRGDRLVRLSASDGIGGSTVASVTPTGARFQKASDATAAPDVFVLEQDAGFTDAKIVPRTAFGDGSSSATATPGTYGLRAIDGAISLARVPTQLASAKLVLAGEAVVIDVANDDLELDSAVAGQPIEIRADFVTLSAGGSTAANDFAVMPGDVAIYGHDTVEGGVDDGDLEVAAAPRFAAREITVRQDSDVTGANLPTPPTDGMAMQLAPDPDERDATLLHVFAEEDAGIALDDEAKLRDLDVSIRLFDFDEDVPRSVAFADGVAFQLHSLDLSVPGALDWSGLVLDLTATESVRIESGTSGVANGDLLFGAGSQITARALDLIAGLGSGATIDVASASDLARIDASPLAVTLRIDPSNTDPTATTSLVFDSDATVDGLGITAATTGTETSLLPTLTTMAPATSIDTIFVRSRRGNAFVDIADVALADVLDVRAGTNSVDGIESTEVGIARLEATMGDLDLAGDFDRVFLQAREIELAASNAGDEILADSDDVILRGTTAATPLRVQLEQHDAFDLTPGHGSIVRAEQITGRGGSALGLDYRLIQETGGFAVTGAVADQLAGFDLTLETRETNAALGGISIDPTADTATSPRFYGFHAKTAGGVIAIDAANFRTLADQSYEGAVRIDQDTRLSASSIRFADTVQGATDGGQSLELDVVDKLHLVKGVGNDGLVAGPTAMNRLRDLTVNFVGGVGELELGSSADPSQDVFGAGSVATALANTDTVAIDLAGDLLVRSVDAVDFAAGTTTPASRKPVARTATIYQRGRGTLAIRTDGNVSLGDYDPNPATLAKDAVLASGEKLTVAGTLDIDALGDVAVGDLTADSIQIDAANLIVLRRPAASVRRSNGSFEPDGGVDWVANDFQLATTGATGALAQLGRGNRLVIGSSAGRPAIDGVPLDAPLFEVNPNDSALGPRQLFYDADPADLDVAPLVLDGRPAGPSTTDLTEALAEAPARPESRASLATPAIEPDAFAEIGIATREATAGELVSRTRASAIFDDASRGWRSDREVARLTAARLDLHNAQEAMRLFEDLFGADLHNAPELRATLGAAVSDFRSQTGARRVLGFELRRFLKNRPSTQFDAYQTLEALDRLFSAHRRTGLVPGEYGPVQRAWVEAITPDGITPDELAEAIHPSRYVRGSDVLDIFGS
ncbi:MAG: filamentous hemagglutinin N-terminal domain-containing protein [Myxococcota bacterium]